jgi:hypothetical protein
LVLNLKLLKVDQMQPLCQLLFGLQVRPSIVR